MLSAAPSTRGTSPSMRALSPSTMSWWTKDATGGDPRAVEPWATTSAMTSGRDARIERGGGAVEARTRLDAGGVDGARRRRRGQGSTEAGGIAWCAS
jgi:hypothetical protein